MAKFLNRGMKMSVQNRMYDTPIKGDAKVLLSDGKKLDVQSISKEKAKPSIADLTSDGEHTTAKVTGHVKSTAPVFVRWAHFLRGISEGQKLPDTDSGKLGLIQSIRGDTRSNPPGWRRVKISAFSVRFFREAPAALTFETQGAENRIMFYYTDGTGLSIVQQETEKLALYKFGCIHQFDVVFAIGKNASKHTCSICGYSQTVDSSD